MKLVLRIFNIVIMALSLVATVFLFVSPAFSFNSNVSLDIASFSQFVPDNEFTQGLDFVDLLGTDTIQVRVKFSLDFEGVRKTMHGDRDVFNNEILTKNADEIVDIIHEPVDLITELAIRNFLKSVVTQEITIAVDDARNKFISEHPEVDASDVPPTEIIMDEVGMNEAYFNNFSYSLYSSANTEGSTTDTVEEVLYEQIDSALAVAEESGMVDTTSFSTQKKADLKAYFISVLEDMSLVEDDGYHIRPIGMIPYHYMIDYMKGELTGKVASSELERKSDEDIPDYSNRLLNMFIITMMPEMVYQVVGYVCLGIFIGIFIIAFAWALLFVITLLKTLTRKPWTVFGFWFWPLGSLQVILGLGLTVFCKFILPKVDVLSYFKFPIQLPIKNLILAPRTFALIPSIIFLVTAVVAIVYAFLKRIVKHQVREEDYEAQFEDNEDDNEEEK